MLAMRGTLSAFQATSILNIYVACLLSPDLINRTVVADSQPPGSYEGTWNDNETVVPLVNNDTTSHVLSRQRPHPSCPLTNSSNPSFHTCAWSESPRALEPSRSPRHRAGACHAGVIPSLYGMPAATCHSSTAIRTCLDSFPNLNTGYRNDTVNAGCHSVDHGFSRR